MFTDVLVLTIIGGMSEGEVRTNFWKILPVLMLVFTLIVFIGLSYNCRCFFNVENEIS